MASGSLAFKEWATSENVAATSTLDHFRGKTVGIDAEDYLHSLLIVGNREPLLPALGGTPFCLWRRLDDDLKGYESAGIKPYFVFNGLDLGCRDKSAILNESRKAASILENAWTTYDNGRGEEAVIMFGKACECTTVQHHV
jgi:hypothetical protein